MYTVLIISVVIVFVVLILSVMTTSKAYNYKHTVDPVEDNPHLNSQKEPNEDKK
jgi:uncharacterized membrane protein